MDVNRTKGTVMTARATRPGRSITRRAFLGASAAAAAFTFVDAASVRGAPANSKIELGVVGCGGRGAWITNLFNQDGHYKISAVADYFPQVAQGAGQQFGVETKRCFSGLGGYKRLIASKVDAVALETPPWAFPAHATAAVEAGCHVYMAKPVACDVPGCLTIAAAAKKATAKKRAFLVDFQIRTDPFWIESVKRVHAGAIGPVSLVCSHYHDEGFADPPLGKTIESRLRHLVWVNDTAIGASYLVNAGIHAVDAALWLLGDKSPVAAMGASGRGRKDPHGDSDDSYSVTYEFADAAVLSHRGEHIKNLNGFQCGAAAYGQGACMEGGYDGKTWVHGGQQGYRGGEVKNLYAEGAKRNIALFARLLAEGDCSNSTVPSSVNSTLTTILGREACLRRGRLTWKELIEANKPLPVDESGLKE